MKKLAIGILSSALILSACSSHKDENENNKTNNTNKSESTSKQENNKSVSHKQEMKETTFSDVFNDGKEHLVYKLNYKGIYAETNDEKQFKYFQNNPEKILNDFDIDGVFNIKDNKGFKYTFSPDSVDDKLPEGTTFSKLSENSISENHRKFEKLLKINIKEKNDNLIEKEDLGIPHSPKGIKKVYYTKNDKLISEDYEIVGYYRAPEDDLDIDSKDIWKPRYDTMLASTDFPKKNIVIIEPFNFKGKTYAGIAKGVYDFNGNRSLIGYSNMLITEVPKNTKIVLDKDTSDGKIKKYEDTDEYKTKKEKEKKEFDNL
ncbi:hypothetical protein [Staphylococcus caledonicus]|uniref:hypothetical protein n=1 Tax=Staphylococcus caledonicus TaxID=2741333 RepID=UPI0018E4671A|nr:hypothetical protein [Staphylococcus caledonicus]MBI5972764.1 hypothetical protein [Staphylococcus caledonicus]